MTIPSLQFQEVSLCDLANAINTDYDYDIRDQLEINDTGKSDIKKFKILKFFDNFGSLNFQSSKSFYKYARI